MKNKKNNPIFTLILIFLVLISQSGTALALDIGSVSFVDNILGVGSPADFFNSILEDLDMDKDELKNQVKTFNVASKKKTPPQVSIMFSPTNPSEGEKITATASPTYFLNDPKKLYYTWFLKTEKCDRCGGNDSCSDDELEYCDLDGNNKVDIEDYKIKAARIIANGGFAYEDTDYNTSGDNDGYEAPSGGDDQRGKIAYCYVHDNVTGEDYLMNSCGSKHDGTRHLFPNFDTDEDGGATGDNSFGRDEEEFWHTDPNSNDTANRGNVDEANVAGLGIVSFSWNYQKGDEVGVVVEGVSIDLAQTDNASYKTMWAMSKKVYSLDATENSEGGFNLEINNRSIEKPSDLNNLLYDALVSPLENNPGSNKLDINLSYSPQNPINDPEGIDGDMLVISSYIPNAEDINYLQYNWKVYASDEVSPNDWGDPLLKDSLKESAQSVGIGIDTFKFRLSLPNPKKYLRVLLTVTEDVGESIPRVNTQDIIIPISSIDGDQIKAFSASATSSSDPNNLSGVMLRLGDEICKTPVESAVCPVTKDQIIGLSIPENNFPADTTDFLWTIDGKSFSYPYCFFEECNPEKQTGVAYFPVLKEVGGQHTITLTATSADGNKINLTKIFKVVDPTIKITSDDTSTCDRVVRGRYFDTDGKPFLDYSDLNFWADICSDIKLKVTSSGFAVSPESYVWNVDGSAVNSSNASLSGFELDNNTGVLTLPPKKTAGESYNVSASALYTQDNLIKKALQKIWNVSYNQFYEKIVSDDAVITMQNNPNANTAQGPTKKIFATIYSSAPDYLAFLMRIFLTISLILFTTKLVFSFAPEINSEED